MTTEPPDRHLPSPLARDVEMVMARHTAQRAAIVGPLLIGLFWLTSGIVGAWSSAVGVAVVVANFLLSGLLLSKAARVSLSLYHAAALGGFFVRLGLIMLTMFVVAQLVEVDRLAMGLSAVASYLVLLTWEAVAVANGAEKELEWSI